MARIAILGGGITGLTAAWELERHRQQGAPADWYLFEASDRLGGTVATTRFTTPEGEYLLEDGPDGWVTEKPWARELAGELGLADEVIPCQEAQKKTYVLLDGRLVPLPPRMRLMVPESLQALEGSPLFSTEAREAYARELTRSAELRTHAPAGDESVASFVRRHFGQEVLAKVAAPLLSGIFGGDVERLSVRAVMMPFVRMEAAHGSLIAGLAERQRLRRPEEATAPTFESLRRGMGSLPEALVAALPAKRLQRGVAALRVARQPAGGWAMRFGGQDAAACAVGMVPFDHLVLALPLETTRRLLAQVAPETAALLPGEASSAVLTTFCWPPERARTVTVPAGFGFLVPPAKVQAEPPQLLAATFADSKYAGRAPAGCRVIRAFFGGQTAERLQGASDETVAALGLEGLRAVLGPLPTPEIQLTTVRRWPQSLPQYEVGHLERVDELETRVQAMTGLHLLGNALRGVGVPDLIRDARRMARTLAGSLT